MDGRATSYTRGEGGRNAPPFFGIVAAAILAAALGACSVGMPLGERNPGRLAAARAAAVPAKVSAVEQLDPSDWETIRREVAAASEKTGHTLTWRNPDTGSNGSVALLPAISKAGTLCRAFAATVNDIRGVHRYGGEACLRTDGRWQLHGVTADDILAT